MKIWIINEYAGTPSYGMEFRHYYIGKELVKLGHEVSVISSSYSHLYKTLPTPGHEKIDGIDYLWLRTLNYSSSHNKLRVLKWFLFTLKIFSLPFRLSRPDVIVVSPMAPFPILPAYLLSKIYKACLVYEVKDIWPLSLIELGGFSPRHPLIWFMGQCERFAIYNSDLVISNLLNYSQHLKNMGIDRPCSVVSNGIDLDEMKNIAFLPEEVQDLLPKNKFIIGYTGTIGSADTLDILLKASRHHSIQSLPIAFVIVGNGRELENLKSEYRNDENVIFIPAIEKKSVQSMLSYFDVCYLGWKKEKMYEYGVSANKLYDYMYSSKPILHAFSGNGDIVKIAQCGVSVEAEDSERIVEGLLKLHSMSEFERVKMGRKGQEYVLEHYTYQKLAKKFEKILED